MLRKIALWSMVLLIIASIYYFSTELGNHSQARSARITHFILAEASSLTSGDFAISPRSFDRLHYLIRKSGHFLEYMMLAFFISMATYRTGSKTFKQSIAVLLLCILFAGADEWIQTFTTGRSGRAMDVLIDSMGAIMGIILYNIVCVMFGKLTVVNRKLLIK